MKRIIFPTDFSDNANHAMQWATNLARKTDAKLVILNTYSVGGYGHATLVNVTDKLREESEGRLALVLKHIREDEENRNLPPLKIETVSENDNLLDCVVELSEAKPTDLIVMGTQGASGLEEVFIGSHTVDIMRNAKVPVLAVPYLGEFREPTKIVIGTDLKEADYTALGFVVEIGKIYDAEIDILHILRPDESFMSDEINEYIAEIKGKIDYEKASIHVFKADEIIEGINEYVAAHDATMLAMVRRRKNFFASLLQRSFTKKMALHCKIPLLVFQEQEAS